MAAIGKLVPTTANVAMAMMTAQSGEKVIEAATKRNSRVFIAYIAVLLVTAILVAVFTWLTWDSGNKVQDAIQLGSNARIAEAKATSDQANERSKKLENDNLILSGSVAGLQIEVAKQQERAANAERDLLALQETIKPRRLSEAQKMKLVRLLSGGPPATPIIAWAGNAVDGETYAGDFADVFRRLGWTVTPQNMRMAFNAGSFVGLSIIINDSNATPPQAEGLLKALKEIGIDASGKNGPIFQDSASATFTIMIGSKN
jgi:hypothetical protein